MEKLKLGRPALPPEQKKKRVAIRLYQWQIDALIKLHGSTQKGINELLKQISQ